MPAAPETVAVWVTAMVDREGGRKPLARSSIDQAFGAVIVYHRDAGHVLDRKHRAQEGVAGHLQPEGQDAAQAPG